jgi:thiol-disulfide isomerase/thioredoxin
MTDTAPATIEDGIMAEEFALVTGASLYKSLLPQLLNTAPFGEIMKDVTVAGLLPDEVIDGTKCRHLLMKKSEHAVDLWIDAGKTQRLVKVKYGLAKAPSQSELALTYLYQNQLLDAPVSAAKFGPAHAGDAVRIGSFIDDPFKNLVGKPAPDAIIKMENGRSFKLSNLKDRVVVLDFWSTSCPPCVISMPIFAQESLRFKDQGVVFIPVNQGDNLSSIRAFMKQHGLAQSAVDADDRLGMLFEAEALPTMVFIGKDGIVKGMHAGIRQDFKEAFISNLKDVLAGKKLVRE